MTEYLDHSTLFNSIRTRIFKARKKGKQNTSVFLYNQRFLPGEEEELIALGYTLYQMGFMWFIRWEV